MNDEAHLPPDILARATRNGNEYGWSVADIPQVIEAARAAGLVNIGGQLQFILPNGTCECYWIDVDTFKQLSTSLPWDQQVQLSARIALAEIQRLQKEKDFIAEGRKAFAEHLASYEASGGNLSDVMRFIWYLNARPHA